jgi:hypothetical protein
MKEIGGYFELELPTQYNGSFLHNEAIDTNYGRAGLEIIVKVNRYRKIYLPDYICPVVDDLLNKLGVEIEKYSINMALEPIKIPRVNSGEGFLYVNYFGVKDDFCNKLITIVPNLILDCTQSYFYIPQNVDAFFSVRKFFGVPDGGFCYLKKSEKIELEDSISYDNCVHLLKRIDCNANSGYQDFQLNNTKMHKWHPQKMSKLTKTILHSIDINRCKCQRSKNFNKLHLALGTSNLLRIPELNNTPPMVYPFLSDKTMELRHKLIENNIFIAKYWPNIKTEFSLEDKILPLVIDQRYTEKDMDFVLEVMSNEF